MQVERRAAVALNEEAGDVGIAGCVAAVGRDPPGDLCRGRTEALAKNDVHDLLVGAIAIFESDLLGQDVDPLDGFCRDVAKLAEARDSLAVKQQYRGFAAAAAGA